MFVATQRILGAYKRHGFFSGTVCGAKGVGKSSYSLQVFHDVFIHQGYDDKTAWQMALDHCLYKITDVVNFLECSTEKENHSVGFIWDDASVFVAGTRWWSHKKEMQLLQSIMTTIRGSISGMLITCPSIKELASFLKNQDDYYVKITHDPNRGGMYRIATGYVRRTTPALQQRVYTNFRDYYSCYLPKWVYDEYCKKRWYYSQEDVKELKRMLKDKGDENDGE